MNPSNQISPAPDFEIAFTRSSLPARTAAEQLTAYAMSVKIDGTVYVVKTDTVLDLNTAASWDTTSPTDYTVAATRAGKDFYVYAVKPLSGTTCDIVLSANASGPSGESAGDFVQIGGFHCLCVAVGTISGHALTGMLAGDILPASIWDLRHRSQGDQEGTVWDALATVWVDIYLASWDGTRLRSVLGATPQKGNSNPAFHWYNFAENFMALKKRFPRQNEFMSFSDGSNQGTNITGSSPTTAGGSVDTASRRMISHIGVEEACGHYYQWGLEAGSTGRGASWVAENTIDTANSYDDVETLARGSSYLAPHRPLFGGPWSYGSSCGSRCAPWSASPLALYSTIGARGVAEPYEI